MDRYYDIRLLPDPEFPTTVLMNALFSKLHRGLVALDSDRIGVSFPGVGMEGAPGLGNELRLHGSAADLERLMTTGWLTGMRDHTRISELASVPSHARYRVVRRVQAKSSPERLRRRLVRRKGIGEQDAARLVPDSVAERLDLPFVTVTSQSTQQTFRLFIEHCAPVPKPNAGRFSSYGLSATATIPWF